MSENQGENAAGTYGGAWGNDNTRTWGDARGSVTTNPDTGQVSWKDYNGGGGSSDNPNTWDKAPTQPTGSFGGVDYQKQLADMFNKDNPDFQKNMEAMQAANKPLGQWTSGLGSMYGQDPSTLKPSQNEDASQALKMAQIYGVSDPGLMRRLGIMSPGTTFDQFKEQQTPAMEADRMGLVNNTLNTVGSVAANAMMPAPMRIGLAGYQAYNNYQKTGDARGAAGSFLGAMPGYFGAAGQALQGNYGAALTGAAIKSGVDTPTAGLAGLGVDASMGKNVTTPAYALGGSIVGNRFGGPVGGVFGAQLGKSLASIFGKK